MRRKCWRAALGGLLGLVSVHCAGSHEGALPQRGPATDYFLRTMLSPETVRVMASESARQRTVFAEAVAGTEADCQAGAATLLRGGSDTVQPDAARGESLSFSSSSPSPVSFTAATSTGGEGATSPPVSAAPLGNAAPGPAGLSRSSGVAGQSRDDSARGDDMFEFQQRGYSIDEENARSVDLSGLQRAAELRRFALVSEEQMQPLNLSKLAAHPAMKPLLWLANSTITPLANMAGEALEDAYATLATQPEVLVWRLQVIERFVFAFLKITTYILQKLHEWYQRTLMICLLQPGDHLRVNGVAGFMALTHHALYVGDGRVMHFTGGVTEKANATVKIDTLHKLTKYMKSVGNKKCRLQVAARTHARTHTHTHKDTHTHTHAHTHTYTHRSFRIRRRRCRGRKSWSVLCRSRAKQATTSSPKTASTSCSGA